MNQVVPQHVGIIMDGNRRWARANAQMPWQGHRQGAGTAEEIVFAAQDKGIKYLTMFAWSLENWQRPVDEVNFAMDVFREFFDKDFVKLKERGIKMQIVGDITAFPKDLQDRMNRADLESADNTGMVLSLCMSYGGREEILLAVGKLMGDLTVTSENLADKFGQLLQSHQLPDVDLMIRTSGEQRLSGFLLWKTAYSELYFTDKLWPEFTPADFDEALKWYAGRDRRYGK